PCTSREPRSSCSERKTPHLMRLTTVLSVASLGIATFVGASPALAQRHSATTTQVTTDIVIPRQFGVNDPNPDVARAEREERTRQIEERCALWRVYEGVGRDAGRCETNNVEEIVDTGGEGDRAVITRTQLVVDVPVAAGRRTETVPIESFVDQSKY